MVNRELSPSLLKNIPTDSLGNEFGELGNFNIRKKTIANSHSTPLLYRFTVFKMTSARSFTYSWGHKESDTTE